LYQNIYLSAYYLLPISSLYRRTPIVFIGAQQPYIGVQQEIVSMAGIHSPSSVVVHSYL